MTRRVPRVLSLGLAMMALAQPGCGSGARSLGPNDAKGYTDGSTDGLGADTLSCAGQPISCVQGGPRGTGVACGDFAMSAACPGGQWTCPSGMVDTRDCTCGAPGVAGCTICTAHGWVCPDASADEASDTAGSELTMDTREAGVDGPRCCPRDPQTFGCVHLGGANQNGFSCLAVCDFFCSYNWRVELDDQGCEVWRMDYRMPAPGENLACQPGLDAGRNDATSGD